MSKVFISHSSSDNNFTSFLAKLLEFHHINTWYDNLDILPGYKFSKEIEDALNNSDSLIAVISKNSLQSDWVKKEVIYFQGKNSDNLVPLILDDTEPSNLCKLTPGLEQYQVINFSKCMLTGFGKLMARFGREFLPDPDKRSGLDRRQAGDRRKSKIDQRMRIGFWKSYENETGTNKFQILDMFLNDRAKMIKALESEVRNYSYSIQGEIREPEKVLEEAVIYAPERVRRINLNCTAVNIIEAVVEYILETYKVKSIDRRVQSDRRENSNRREKVLVSH